MQFLMVDGAIKLVPLDVVIERAQCAIANARADVGDELFGQIRDGALVDAPRQPVDVQQKLLMLCVPKYIATRALAEFLVVEPIRPLHAWVALHNVASIRVLEKAGYTLEGRLRRSVVKNGKIIEQEQILTTHNLASLVVGLGLKSRISADLTELARSCFRWVCRQQQQKRTAWHSQLRMVKNTAYAFAKDRLEGARTIDNLDA